MKPILCTLVAAALAGAAHADPRETQTFAGPYGIWDEEDPRATTLAAAFTGVDNGTPYTPRGVRIVMDIESVVPITWAMDVVVRVIPPSGPSFLLYMADGLEYDTIIDATAEQRLAAAVSPIGTWGFRLYDQFEDDGGPPDALITNVRISMLDLPAVEPPAPVNDLGTLGTADLVLTVPDYSGADVIWYKFTVPEPVTNDGSLYVDINTIGSTIGPGASLLADDTTIGLYEAAGLFIAANDDIAYPDDVRSFLTFGSTETRDRGDLAVYNGGFGGLQAGEYYLAVGAFMIEFDDEFQAAINSISPGGSLTVNIFSNFPATGACSPADLGLQGGQPGQDRRLDNNDFIVFIDHFFNQDPVADFGIQGGVAGHDGAFDNNDFIAFIDAFFNDQSACTG